MHDQPSRTAMGSAVLRAAHVREDAPPWVLEDSLSERLLDRRSLRQVRAEIARWAPQVRAACVDLLERAGFSSITPFDAAALKERYFPHRRELQLPDSTLICVARV